MILIGADIVEQFIRNNSKTLIFFQQLSSSFSPSNYLASQLHVYLSREVMCLNPTGPAVA